MAVEVPTPAFPEEPALKPTDVPLSKPSHSPWPAEGKCLWGPWLQKTGLPKPTEYRQCVHPECSKVDYREGTRA